MLTALSASLVATCASAPPKEGDGLSAARENADAIAPELVAVPGPAPRRRTFDALAVNARCESCHVDVAAEWRGSLHQVALTDPVVRHQLEREPFPFCTGCHAPESAAPAGAPDELSRLGVGCVTCHVVGERLLASHASREIENDAPAPHRVDRTADFDGSMGCGACHEFAFPEARRTSSGLLMQSTVGEHARSAFADRSCGSCHMPVVAGASEGAHKSHRFASSRDEASVRSAIRVDQAITDGQLVLTLRPGDVGHAFPTGDMLRRLTLAIDVVDANGESLGRAEHHFQRSFGFERLPFQALKRIEIGDDRVGAGASPVVFRYALPKRALPNRASPSGGRGATLHYTLRYERVSDPSGGAGADPVIDGSILLREATIPL